MITFEVPYLMAVQESLARFFVTFDVNSPCIDIQVCSVTLKVTSRKDQGQYWADKTVPYNYVSVSEFVEGFKKFHVGQTLASELAEPYPKSQSHPGALSHGKYGLGKREVLKACFAREIILMKRNIVTYNAKIIQVNIQRIHCLFKQTLELNGRILFPRHKDPNCCISSDLTFWVLEGNGFSANRVSNHYLHVCLACATRVTQFTRLSSLPS